MKTVFLLLLSFWSYTAVQAQDISKVKVDDILRRIEQGGDTTYIINFWATWCAPCVKELPYFEAVNKDHKADQVKVLLVSLDFKKDLETRLPAFVAKRNLQSEVLFLDEKDPNEWIPKFTDKWEGVIPATLIVRHAKGWKQFRAAAFEEGELEQWLRELAVIQ